MPLRYCSCPPSVPRMPAIASVLSSLLLRVPVTVKRIMLFYLGLMVLSLVVFVVRAMISYEDRIQQTTLQVELTQKVVTELMDKLETNKAELGRAREHMPEILRKISKQGRELKRLRALSAQGSLVGDAPRPPAPETVVKLLLETPHAATAHDAAPKLTVV